MPEEFEEQEISETQEQDNSEVEAEEDQRVPVSVVKELREELRRAKESEDITRRQMTSLMSEFQKMSQGQNNKAQEMVCKLDPAVQAELAPYLSALEQKFQGKLEDIERSKTDLENELRSLKAKDYILSNVPNFQELRPHIENFLQNEYTPEERQEMTPKELVRVAKFVARQKGLTTSTKSASRSMAKTESGSSTSNRSESVKPSELQGDKFREYLKNNGFFD